MQYILIHTTARRKRAQTNEDNTKKQYFYNDAENIIEIISENGLNLLYFYDKYGKMISVRDKNLDISLMNRVYDTKERLISESNSTGADVGYTYDGLDRYTSVVVTDADGNVIGEKYLAYDEAYKSEGKTYTRLLLSESLYQKRTA